MGVHFNMRKRDFRLTLSLRSIRSPLLIYISYLLVTVYLSWPLVTVFSTYYAGHTFADSYEYAGHIWWFKYALQTGAPLFSRPLLAYPDGLNAAWLWGNPLQSFPAWLFAFVMPLPAAFNLALLLTLALNGLAAYTLAYHLTGKRLAAWLAGLTFMAYPTFSGQMAAGHIGLLALWGVPLYTLALFKLREGAGGRWLVAGGVCFMLSMLGSTLVLIYMLLPITAVFGLMLVMRREWRGLRWMMGTVLLGSVLVLPFLLPTALEMAQTPARLREGGDILFSADLLSAVTPSFENPLFKGLAYTSRVLGRDPFEKAAYIGIVAGVMAMVGLWRNAKARWWLMLGVVAWVFSLGPVLKIFDAPVQTNFGGYETYITLPWFYAQNIPLLNISRTPARFNFTLALAVAMLVGYGFAKFQVLSTEFRVKNIQKNATFKINYLALAAVVVGAGILFEGPVFWAADGSLPKLPVIAGVVPAQVEVLAERDDIRAVFDIPWEHPLTDKAAMYLQTGHHQALIAGHIARQTPVDPAKLNLLQNTLDAALLDAAGVDVVILHKEFDDNIGDTEVFVKAHLGEPIYEDGDIAVFDVPEPTDELGFISMVTMVNNISGRADSYAYAPEAGWVRFSGHLDAAGRDVALYLNDVRVGHWLVEGGTDFDVPLYLPEVGYYTVSLAVEPACPTEIDPTLACKMVALSDAAFGDFQAGMSAASVQFDKGITLNGAQVVVADGTLSLDLSWAFSRALTENDVRFVHVQAVDGTVMPQTDNTFGVQPIGGWAETVTLDVGDLPAGEYQVYVGWYAYPDTTPFGVLKSALGENGGRALVGTFEIQ